VVVGGGAGPAVAERGVLDELFALSAKKSSSSSGREGVGSIDGGMRRQVTHTPGAQHGGRAREPP
jgi:hypothetical protein